MHGPSFGSSAAERNGGAAAEGGGTAAAGEVTGAVLALRGRSAREHSPRPTALPPGSSKTYPGCRMAVACRMSRARAVSGISLLACNPVEAGRLRCRRTHGLQVYRTAIPPSSAKWIAWGNHAQPETAKLRLDVLAHWTVCVKPARDVKTEQHCLGQAGRSSRIRHFWLY